MAKKTSNTGRGGDGVKYLGFRDGRKWWQARLFWIDARTGKHREKRVTFQADSKPLAMMQRADELDRARGLLPTVTRKKFSEASEAWIATITVKGTRLTWESQRKKLCAHFGDSWLDMIPARLIQDYLDALKLSPTYVNSRRDVMSHIFDLGITKGWCMSNPCKDVKRRSGIVGAADEDLADAPRRALTDDEVVLFLEDLRTHYAELYPLVVVQLALGCRFAEVSALRREDVDLNTGLVSIRRGQFMGAVGRTKGKYARRAALPMSARKLLQEHLDRMAFEQWPGWETLLFPRPPFGRDRHSNHWSISTASKNIERSFRRVGLTAIKGKTHVARHTMITLTTGLASEAVLRRVVGHKSAAVHAGYQHAHDAKVIELADVVGQRLRIETGSETGSSASAGSKSRPKTPSK